MRHSPDHLSHDTLLGFIVHALETAADAYEDPGPHALHPTLPDLFDGALAPCFEPALSTAKAACAHDLARLFLGRCPQPEPLPLARTQPPALRAARARALQRRKPETTAYAPCRVIVDNLAGGLETPQDRVRAWMHAAPPGTDLDTDNRLLALPVSPHRLSTHDPAARILPFKARLQEAFRVHTAGADPFLRLHLELCLTDSLETAGYTFSFDSEPRSPQAALQILRTAARRLPC